MRNNRAAMDKMLYLLVGGAIGAGLGFLFAPQTGEDTRDDIARSVRKGRRFILSRSKAIRRGVSNVIERGRETIF